MTTLQGQDLDEAAGLAHSNPGDVPDFNEPPADFGAELRHTTAAVRLSHEKLGVHRKLDRQQIIEAAAAFDAVPRAIRAVKRLLDTGHPAFRAVTRVRSDATGYWRAVTVPFPESGVRLIQRNRIEAFEVQLQEFRTQLADAAGDLQAVYSGLRDAARHDLGDLFNPADYPDRIDTCFSMSWEFPSTEPPAYLKELAPELYAREQQRIAGRFDEAVRMAEEAFAQELAALVEHLAERLVGEVDGKPKIFRDTALDRLRDFAGRFRELSIGSNEQLTTLVENTAKLLEGVSPEDLRGSTSARERVAASMTTIGKHLEGLMVDRSKRAIDLEDEGGA